MAPTYRNPFFGRLQLDLLSCPSGLPPGTKVDIQARSNISLHFQKFLIASVDELLISLRKKSMVNKMKYCFLSLFVQRMTFV